MTKKLMVGVHVKDASLYYELRKLLDEAYGRPARREEIAFVLFITEKAIEAIELRFDKEGVVVLRLEDTGKKMGISMERVRQITGLALSFIRKNQDHIKRTIKNIHGYHRQNKETRSEY